MAANSSLGASSSLERIGGGTTSPGSGTSSTRRRARRSGRFSKCVSRMASCAVPGSSTTELRGLGSGMARRRRDEDVDLAVGPELELVDVGLRLRARAARRPGPARTACRRSCRGRRTRPGTRPAGRSACRRARRTCSARRGCRPGASCTRPGGEELRVQRVGPLHDPVEDQPGQPGHPAVALGQVDVGLGHARGLAHHVERRRLCLHPGVECCVQPVVLHPGDATHVSAEFPVLRRAR